MVTTPWITCYLFKASYHWTTAGNKRNGFSVLFPNCFRWLKNGSYEHLPAPNKKTTKQPLGKR